MSAIPSLSVWSSLKIPLTEYYGRSWNDIKSTVPYVGSWKPIQQKSRSETTREVVNLRVPSAFRKIRETSQSEITCACHEAHKRDFRNQHKNINCLSVPNSDEDFLENSSDSHYHKLNYQNSYDDFYMNSDESFPDVDTEMSFDCIPSVKPWTSEELRMLNQRYHLVEERERTTTDKKKKHKRRVKITRSEQSAPTTPNTNTDCYKSVSQNFRLKDQNMEERDVSSNENLDFHLSENSDCSIVQLRQPSSYTPVKPTSKHYYETKLAELYMIELGIKR